MVKNRKAAIMTGILVSVVLCATGFVNKTEALQTERVIETCVLKPMESIADVPRIDRTYAETVQTIRGTIVEEQEKTVELLNTQKLLASIIFCEAGNQSYEGQVAVGAVVMNRVKSGSFPNTVEEVIYQSGQFTPACTGWLDQIKSTDGYTETAMQAAADALAGVNPVGSCLYFDRGGSGMQIGEHYFH